MLTQSVESYVAMRRAAGFAFKSPGSLLKTFAAFSEARGECYVRAPIAIEWAGLAQIGSYPCSPLGSCHPMQPISPRRRCSP